MTGAPDGTGVPGLAAALALATLAAACGGSGGDAEAGGAATSGRDTAAPETTDTAAAAGRTDDSRPLRAFRFRVGNEGGDTAVIVADAGAGARTLDTVPPADSAEVRVETRASLLELRARSGSGEELARSRYDLERPAGDTLLDFPVPPAASRSDSTGA